MTHEPGLSEALRRQANQVGHAHPISLEDVQGTARGIRRRRAAVSGLAVAAVLAVAAPIGLTLGDTPADRGETPVAASSGVKDGLLTTKIDAAGAEPGIPYLYDGEIHLPDGGTIDVPGQWTAFDTLGDGFVVATGSRLAVLDADGDVVVEQPTRGGTFAVSADHSLVAHVSDGQVQAIDAAGERFSVPIPGQVQSPEVTGVEGSESCDPSAEGGGCVFYVNDRGTAPQGYSLTSKGIINPLGGFVALNDVSVDGWVSGIVAIDELAPGTCNEVWDDPFADAPSWETCDRMPTEFSPDGSMLLAAPAYRDGFGDGYVGILDAEDGTVLADWQNSRSAPAAAVTTAWDADGTVLAMVSEDLGQQWSLMRFDPDGGLSKVKDVEGDGSGGNPILLAGGS